MNKLKAKLKAIWMILKADGFDVAVNYSTKRGYCLWTTSVFGKSDSANIIHNDIGNKFAYWQRAIEECNKNNEIKQWQDSSE